MLASILLSVIEPISAAMLAVIVVRTNAHHRVPFLLRLCVASLAFGLVVHAGSQIELLFNYRQPRTWAWLALIVPINAGVWVLFVLMLRHEKARPPKAPSTERAPRASLMKYP